MSTLQIAGYSLVYGIVQLILAKMAYRRGWVEGRRELYEMYGIADKTSRYDDQRSRP